jgi:hypothetical protein
MNNREAIASDGVGSRLFLTPPGRAAREDLNFVKSRLPIPEYTIVDERSCVAADLKRLERVWKEIKEEANRLLKLLRYTNATLLN